MPIHHTQYIRQQLSDVVVKGLETWTGVSEVGGSNTTFDRLLIQVTDFVTFVHGYVNMPEAAIISSL